MKITVVQIDVSYRDKDINLSNLRNALSITNDLGELVLLPELFTTGYLFDDPNSMHELSESMDDSPTLIELQAIAKEYGIVIVCGIAEKSGSYYYNSAVVVDNTGLLNSYRKISQTTIDKNYFSRGNKLLSFELFGITFGVAICFDIWFPEIVRSYTEHGVDVLLHPANFGKSQSLYIARATAIANACYVITCNRIGTEHSMGLVGNYCGKSQVVNASGEIVQSAGSAEEIFTVDIEPLTSKNKKVLNVDISKEKIQILDVLENKYAL